jgi:MFS family permease
VTEPTPLRRNRDFQILWSGQVVSELGTRVSGVAVPLLVLALTGSPAKAGIAGFVGTLPLLVLTLPAGALLDRWNRKAVMLACDAGCALAHASLVLTLWLGGLSYAQILLVGLVEGIAYPFFSVAERAALRQVVPTGQLSAAVAQNQARQYGSLLLGLPLGGVLFGVARLAPFLFDAVSYAASFCSLLLIRTPFQELRERRRRRLGHEIVEGLRWLWSRPFLRTTALLAAASDLTVNSLYLVVIVVAKQQGASDALVGAMLGFLGLGGMLGAIIAPWTTRRLAPQAGIYATLWIMTALLPLLAIVRGAIPLGIVYGAMFVAYPTWSSVVGAYRAAMVPDRLQARIQSAHTLFALGPVPLGSLAVGFALEAAGSTPTIAALFVLMLAVAVVATASRAIRAVPPLADAAAASLEDGQA